MKIAVASEKEDVNGNVSEVAGRAKYYLIFENGELVKALKNPFAMGGGGAGFGVVKMLSNEGVKKIIVGRVGGNFKNSAEQKGIEVVEFSGPVNEAI